MVTVHAVPTDDDARSGVPKRGAETGAEAGCRDGGADAGCRDGGAETGDGCAKRGALASATMMLADIAVLLLIGAAAYKHRARIGTVAMRASEAARAAVARLRMGHWYWRRG
jgi:hypothetical protein